ncbi:MAG: 2OG-Fe(II) oxygenase [Oligoflexia bacterium]|nr:2OG-Fe(II) oxygenase [Oligoflexia bacterium]
MMFKIIADQIEASGFSVCPDFLTAEELSEVCLDLDAQREAGRFHFAGVGHGVAHMVDQEIRRDEICWLDRVIANKVQLAFWKSTDLLKDVCNGSPLYLGLDEFDAHYAIFPKGGFYKRHKDTSRNNKERVVTFILYLNRKWKIEDGGSLRIFVDPLNPDSYIQVDPIGGTMVCFLSDEFEHEVCTSYADRFSISGWFKASTKSKSW